MAVTPNERITWSREPVVGERVSGLVADLSGHGWSASFDGIYDGVVVAEDPDEGWYVHRFHDGILGITPQSHFGFVAGQRDGIVEIVKGVSYPCKTIHPRLGRCVVVGSHDGSDDQPHRYANRISAQAMALSDDYSDDAS